jgi:hypothetical protein
MKQKSTEEALIKRLSKKPTYREEANAITHQCLRAGFIEELHAGKDSELIKDPSYSRISQEEMKKLMIETSAKIAEFLRFKDKNPEKYKKMINGITFFYTSDWDKRLKEYKIK